MRPVTRHISCDGERSHESGDLLSGSHRDVPIRRDECDAASRARSLARLRIARSLLPSIRERIGSRVEVSCVLAPLPNSTVPTRNEGRKVVKVVTISRLRLR